MSSVNFVLWIVGTFFFWTSFGVIQEHIFKQLAFPYPFVGAVIHQAVLATLSALHLAFLGGGVVSSQRHGRRRPRDDEDEEPSIHSDFSSRRSDESFSVNSHTDQAAPIDRALFAEVLKLGASEVSMRATINWGLAMVDYNTKILITSSRLLPVMGWGVLYFRQRYGTIDYVAAACLCLGLMLFTQADASDNQGAGAASDSAAGGAAVGDSINAGQFRWTGVWLMFTAIFFDAFRYNLKQRLVGAPSRGGFGQPKMRVFLWANISGLFLSFIAVLVTGELLPGFRWLAGRPSVLLEMLLMYSCAYGGALSVLSLIQLSSAYTATIVQGARTACSVALSFLLFTKPFHFTHLLGALAFTCGILLSNSSSSSSVSTTSSISSKRNRGVDV